MSLERPHALTVPNLALLILAMHGYRGVHQQFLADNDEQIDSIQDTPRAGISSQKCPERADRVRVNRVTSGMNGRAERTLGKPT